MTKDYGNLGKRSLAPRLQANSLMNSYSRQMFDQMQDAAAQASDDYDFDELDQYSDVECSDEEDIIPMTRYENALT